MEESELYPIAKADAENIISEIQSVYGVRRSVITWKDFSKLLQEVYGVIIEPNQFANPILSQRFAGVLKIGKSKAIISYNNGIYQAATRQHFTIVHEGVHFMNHRINHGKGQQYTDILENGSYSPEEQQEELLANQTASIIMLNDEALEDCMHTGKWCYQITESYGMSATAVFYRILNYLRFNLKLPQKKASYLASRYRYGTNPAARTFLCFFINNFENIMNWVNNGYHEFVHWLSFCNSIGYPRVPNSYWYQINHLIQDSVIVNHSHRNYPSVG